MPHAVLVRRPMDYLDPDPKPLAIDIPSCNLARRIAHRLARSYRCHGWHKTTGVYWFRDDEGLTEIWAQPQ